MAALAGTMLIWPGTALDRLWSLNEPAHIALAPLGKLIGPLFYLFSIVLMIGTIGWVQPADMAMANGRYFGNPKIATHAGPLSASSAAPKAAI